MTFSEGAAWIAFLHQLLRDGGWLHDIHIDLKVLQVYKTTVAFACNNSLTSNIRASILVELTSTLST